MVTENSDQIPNAYRNYPAHKPAADEESAAEAKRRRQREFPPAPEPLPVAVVDNHTHLNFRPEFGNITATQAMDAAETAGVNRAVQVGFDVESSRFTVAALDEEPRLLGAVALHPNDAARAKAEGNFEAQFAEIVALSRHPRVRAIGETGLDYFRTKEELRAGQREAFEEHIALTKERGIAVMIHDRDAHDDVVATLKRVGAPEKVVFHCFSGDEKLAEICMDNGWYMSFAGTVTFNNSTGVKAACALADPGLMLVETDAPFLTPAPYRGKPNASYMVPTTVRFMAELRNEPLEQLCERLSRNSETVYGPW